MAHTLGSFPAPAGLEVMSFSNQLSMTAALQEWTTLPTCFFGSGSLRGSWQTLFWGQCRHELQALAPWFASGGLVLSSSPFLFPDLAQSLPFFAASCAQVHPPLAQAPPTPLC